MTGDYDYKHKLKEDVDLMMISMAKNQSPMRTQAKS